MTIGLRRVRLEFFSLSTTRMVNFRLFADHKREEKCFFFLGFVFCEKESLHSDKDMSANKRGLYFSARYMESSYAALFSHNPLFVLLNVWLEGGRDTDSLESRCLLGRELLITLAPHTDKCVVVTVRGPRTGRYFAKLDELPVTWIFDAKTQVIANRRRHI